MDPNNPAFPDTRWSLVKAIQQGDERASQQAMEKICRRYWYPIYAYLRHSGHSPSDAEDLTQGFFHRLIRQDAMLMVREEFGHLRSYLLGVLKHHLRDQKRHDSALKRGGDREFVEFDETIAEQRYRLESGAGDDLDKLFDRAWAVGVLTSAEAKLREQFRQGDNEEAFDHLREFLPLGENATSYQIVAANIGAKEEAVGLQVHRMRQRYRGLVEQEVGLTVNDPAEVKAELEYLMKAIGR